VHDSGFLDAAGKGDMLKDFDHLTVAVNDVYAAVAAYSQLLGSVPSWRGDHPELGTSAALFGLSNALIELVGPRHDAQAAESEGMRAWLADHGEGLQAIAFGTHDAGSCSAGLRARGLRATPPEEGEARSADGSLRSYRTVELSTRNTRGLPILAVERADATQLRARRAPDPACVDALDHVVIRSADLDAAIALYGTGLGLRLALDRVVGGTRMLFFRIGGVTVEVVHDPAQLERDTFGGAAYRVRDIDAAHARMRSAGMSLSEPRLGAKPGTQVFSVRDGSCGVPTLIVRDPSRD
jgi:catechol 2,3-dioxygenase-like lactoylglutathione lyase family enzyme